MGFGFHGGVGAEASTNAAVRLLPPTDGWPAHVPAPDVVRELVARALREPHGATLRSVPGRRTARPAPGLIHKEFDGAGSPAEGEAMRLAWLHEAGVRAPRALAVGRVGSRTVLAMEEIEGARTLPEALRSASASERARLARALGALVGRLHGARLFHRDLYVEHVLVQQDGGLVLLDAGRVLRRPLRPGRWAAKDLAAVLHSLPRALGSSVGRLAWGTYCRELQVVPARRSALLRSVRQRRVRMERHWPRHGAVEDRPRHLAIQLPAGDASLAAALPVVEAACAAREWGRVTVLAAPDRAERLGLDPSLGCEVWPVPGGELQSGMFEHLLPDAVLLLEPTRAAARAARRARVPRVAGLALDGCGPLLTDGLVPSTLAGHPLDVPLGERYAAAAGLLGLVVPDGAGPSSSPMGRVSDPVPLAAAESGASRPAAAGPGPRLLVRLPNWLGDVVMAAPVVEALARHHGERLTVAGPARWLEVLAPVLGRAPRRVSLGADRRLPAEVARGHDGALLLDGSTRTAWSVRRAGVHVIACGASGGRALLASHAVRAAHRWGRFARTPRPFSATARELLGALPSELGAAVQDPSPRLPVAPEARARMRVLLQALGVEEPFVLVNAGARPGSAKGLPPELLQATLESLEARGFPVIVAVGPGEAARLEGVQLGAAHALVEEPPDLALLGALGAQAFLTITPDGGGRHLVRASGGRTLTLFGPTDPLHSASAGPAEARLRRPVPCGPCHEETCPLAGQQGRLRCFLELVGDPLQSTLQRALDEALEARRSPAPSGA